MNNLTLRQLRYFEALARHGHFGRAAEACAISQPALSLQIKELEETLDTPLFERGARHVRLTGFGATFAERVRKILRSVDELDELARVSGNRLVGQLRLGVIPTIGPYLLPAIVGKLHEVHGTLDIRVRETMTSKLLVELREGRLDAAILALPISEPAFEEIALFSESFILVRPRADAGKPVPGSDALRELQLLLLEEGHCFRDQALAFCAMQSTTPRDQLDASCLSTLVQMVGAGLGVTLIPEMAVAVETPTAEVSLARLADPQPSRSIGMIWRKTSPLAPQLTDIAEIVRTAASEVRARQPEIPTSPEIA